MEEVCGVTREKVDPRPVGIVQERLPPDPISTRQLLTPLGFPHPKTVITVTLLVIFQTDKVSSSVGTGDWAHYALSQFPRPDRLPFLLRPCPV